MQDSPPIEGGGNGSSSRISNIRRIAGVKKRLLLKIMYLNKKETMKTAQPWTVIYKMH